MAKETVAKVDLNALKEVQGNISEEDQQRLGLEAISEAEAEDAQKVAEEKKSEEGAHQEESTEQKEEGKTGKTDAELLAAADADLTAEELPKKQALIKVKEDVLVNAKEEDLDDDKKAERDAIIKARGEKEVTDYLEKERITPEQKAEAEAFATKNNLSFIDAHSVLSYAKEYNLQPEDALKDYLEVAPKIVEKYKGDPKQLARANLHLQRLYTKSQEGLKKLQDAKAVVQPPEITSDAIIKLIEDGKIKLGKETATRETIIEAYRKDNADDVVELSDDAIFKLALKQMREDFGKALKDQADTEKAKLTDDAKEKREQVLGGLSEADKKYLPELKPLLDKVSDAGVMASEFSVETYIHYIKGQHYDEDVRATAEREYKRGKEEAKIVKPKTGNPPGPKHKRTLTAEEKQRALNMYGENMSEDEAITAYIDYLESEKT